MSSSFRPTTESKVAANKFVPRRGISFALQVAILAGLVTWAIVQLSSRAIEQEQRRDYVAKQQASLQGPLSSLANDISRPLDTGQNLRVQKTISTRFADKNVMLLNANSEVWQFGATRNSALPPLPIDECLDT